MFQLKYLTVTDDHLNANIWDLCNDYATFSVPKNPLNIWDKWIIHYRRVFALSEFMQKIVKIPSCIWSSLWNGSHTKWKWGARTKQWLAIVSSWKGYCRQLMTFIHIYIHHHHAPVLTVCTTVGDRWGMVTQQNCNRYRCWKKPAYLVSVTFC